MLKGTKPYLVLSVLKDGELYGYEIAQHIRERSGARWRRVRGASTRRFTTRLEQQGPLVAEWREATAARGGWLLPADAAGGKLLVEVARRVGGLLRRDRARVARTAE